MKTFTLSSVLFVLGLFQGLQAQPSPILEQYLAEGIEKNFALKQERLEVAKSLESLRQAKGMFLPNISFNASYTQAAGGRNISIPVGSLVNPIYNTLNDLTDSQRFPTDLGDVQEQLLPDNFHDTRVQIRQPLFNSELYHNLRAKRSLVSVRESKRQVYQAELIKEIKVAYYQYLQTESLLRILRQTETLLQELLRVNEKLVENHKATIDVVYRAQFELSDLHSQMAQAEKDQQVARSYFNFLLNRDLQEDIIIDEDLVIKNGLAQPSQEYQLQALTTREELQQIQHAIQAQNHLIKLQQGKKLPKLSLGAQAGYQGFGYDLGSTQDYALIQLNLEFPIFTGFQNNSKIQQSRIQLEQLETQHHQLQKQIRVQVIEAYQNVQAALADLQSKQAGSRSANSNFKIISRKYLENMVLLVEYLDARTLYTNSQTSLAIAKYQLLIRQAEFERMASL